MSAEPDAAGSVDCIPQPAGEAVPGTVEVGRDPPAPTLADWRTGHGTPEAREIRAIVQQVGCALEKLHGQGLGHFALNPAAILVLPEAEGPRFSFGDFKAIPYLAGTDLIAIDFDVFYAPPEAAGLDRHPAGELLSAWDWWSLGRIVQELILGHSGVDLLPPELFAKPARDRRAKAEALLFERDVGQLRSGLVELMPRLEPAVDRLLRGLLTSAPEGRWGAPQVREWLAGQNPSEHYAAPRHQRFFRLAGRGHSPAEAARALLGPDHWRDMIPHVFAVDEPGRLAHFLNDPHAKSQDYTHLKQATELTKAAALKEVPTAMTQEIAAAIALVSISGGGFRWRGQPLAEALPAMLQDSRTIERTCTLLRALGLPVVVDLLHRYDSSAAEQVESLVGAATEAEGLLARCVRLRAAAPEDRQRLWLEATAPTAGLSARLAELHRTYACSTLPELEQLFAAPNPSRGTMVLLVWAGNHAARFGFKTHQQMKAEQLAQWSEQGRRLAQLLFWRRFERAMRAGPLLFGNRWPFLAGGLTIMLLLAVHVPGPPGVALGLLPLAAFALLRFGVNQAQAGLVHSWTGAAPWTWRDRPSRCRLEASRLAAGRGLPFSITGITAQLRQVNRDLAALAPPDPVRLVPWPPRHAGVWLASLSSWLALVILATGSVWRAVHHPINWNAQASAWHQAFEWKKAAPAAPAIAKKLPWPYRLQVNSPFPPVEVNDDTTFEANPAQAAAALARGRQLVQQYQPDTITEPVAVYVPLGGTSGGLLLYNGNKDALQNAKGPVVHYVPFPKQWLHIGDDYAIFIQQ